MDKNDRMISRKDIAVHGNMTCDYAVSRRWFKNIWCCHQFTPEPADNVEAQHISSHNATQRNATPRHVRATCGIFQKLKSLKSSSASEQAGSPIDLVDWDTDPDTDPAAADPKWGDSASVFREEEAEE